jgi:hypothetical protein
VKAVLLAGALALVLSGLASADPLPPCTCDPSILDCLTLSDGSGSAEQPSYCPSTDDLPSPPSGVPSIPDVHVPPSIDPRNWPCTCDPQPVWW